MATIYQASPGELIAQPDRQMATFASGLVRVDQTFIGVTSSATTHRSTLAAGSAFPSSDTDPVIDGLYIFPTPQEVLTGDGFSQYKVSAYGRTSTDYIFDGYDIESLSADMGVAGDPNTTLGVTMKRQAPRFLRVSTRSEISQITISELIDSGDALVPFDVIFTITGEDSDTLTTSTLVEISQSVNAEGNVTSRTYQTTINGGEYTLKLREPMLFLNASRNFGEFFELEYVSRTYLGRKFLSPVI